MPPKPAPTHFLCIPLSGAQLTRSLASFRADVTDPNSFGIPPQAIRPIGTLHLTLGVMTLRGQESVAQTTEFLSGLKLREVLDQARSSLAAAAAAGGSQAAAARAMGLDTPSEEQGGDLVLTLKGLNPMQSPSKTSVLYAPPTDSTGLLRRFCEMVRTTFQEAGLMVAEERPLLLHATIVNTLYIGNRKQRKMMLDARDMLAKYGEQVWLDRMVVDRLTLCRMGAKKVDDERGEVYEVEAEVKF